MNEPLSYLPYAIAAGDGRAANVAATALVAAGLTLLQRSASLVRALSGRRSAIALPPGPGFFVALAASDGRAAVLLDPEGAPSAISRRIAAPDVGAVFTTRELAAQLDASVPRVIMNAAPRRAQCIIGDVVTDVDLGSHHGLHVEARLDVEASRDVAVVVSDESGTGELAFTHHDVLSRARHDGAAIALTSRDAVLSCLPLWTLPGLTWSIAPLLVRGWSSTNRASDTADITYMLQHAEITALISAADLIDGLPDALEGERRVWGPGLRVVVCTGARAPAASAVRWFEGLGVPVRML